LSAEGAAASRTVLLRFLLPFSDTSPLLLFQRADVSGQVFQCKQVFGMLRRRLQYDCAEKVRGICRQGPDQRIVGPVASSVGRDETTGGKQLEMAGDIGLRLAQHFRQFTDAQVSAAEQRDDAGACRVTQCSCYGYCVNCIGHIRYRIRKSRRPSRGGSVNMAICVDFGRIASSCVWVLTI